MNELFPCVTGSGLLLLLFAGAVTDLREKTIPILFPAAGAALGIVLQCLWGQLPVTEILLGCIPGALLLILALATRQAVGFGDGAMFLVSGIFLGAGKNILLFFLSLLLTGLTGVILIAAGKKKARKGLPFLPFMFAGYVLLLIVTQIPGKETVPIYG